MGWIRIQGGDFHERQFTLPSQVVGETGRVFALQQVAWSGGNGIVLRANRLTQAGSIDRVCAIKFLRRLDGTRMDRFKNEIRVMRELDCQYVAPFYDCGTVALASGPEVPWLATELGGENLRMHVHKVGVLPRKRLVEVARQLCQAAAHVHAKGFIHRDIKPANFVWQYGSQDEIQMIDFGIAKKVGEDVSARPLDQLTQTLEFVGPVFFSSPELIAYADDKTHPVDHRSDLFQLGKVIWYLACGKVIAGIPSRACCPCGGKLWEIVMRLLPDEPGERFQTAEETLKAIEAL